jgi:hypothetical protein
LTQARRKNLARFALALFVLLKRPMLRAFQRLFRELAKPDAGIFEPDESLWSPSGWSEAATGPNAGPQYYAAQHPTVEAPVPVNSTSEERPRSVA